MLCKEASGDTVSDECGLFKGPQGRTLSLIPQPAIGGVICSAHHQVTTGHIDKDKVRMPRTNLALVCFSLCLCDFIFVSVSLTLSPLPQLYISPWLHLPLNH